MKKIILKIINNYLSLYIATLIISGFKINNGFAGYTKAALVLSLIVPLIKPVLKVVLLPINFLTFGLFNFLINFILIYLFTTVIEEIEINPYFINSFSLYGITLGNIYLSKFFIIIIVSLILSVCQKLFTWITSE